jgi:hypothetical protein
VRLGGLGVASVSPWKLSISGKLMAEVSVGRKIEYIGNRGNGWEVLVVRVVLLESGIESLSVSESDAESYASGSKGLFRSVSGRDGIAVFGCLFLIVRVVGLGAGCESASESESEMESLASGSNR